MPTPNPIKTKQNPPWRLEEARADLEHCALMGEVEDDEPRHSAGFELNARSTTVHHRKPSRSHAPVL